MSIDCTVYNNHKDLTENSSYCIIQAMNVKRLRKRFKVSQARLAKILGVHPMTISRWERKVIKPSRIVILCLKLLEKNRFKGVFGPKYLPLKQK